jgi:hypothetical protein
MHLISKATLYTALFSCLSLYSCEKKEATVPELTVPTTYDGSAFFTVSAQESTLVNNYLTFSSILKSGNDGSTVNPRDLNLGFSTNSPSIKSATTPSFITLMEGTNGYFDKLSKASAGTYFPGANSMGIGGVYGNYVFNGDGIEPAEIIEKGLLGAAFYNYGLKLYIDNPNIANPASVDRLLALYGTSPDFPNSSNAAFYARPDKALAAYAAQRDKGDDKGIYSQIKTQFIKLQAAYKGGSNYDRERNQSFSDLLTLWEKVLAASAIHSCQQTLERLQGTNPTDPLKAQALHWNSSSIGFLLGLRTIPNKTITDAKIDEILVKLYFVPQGTSSAHKVVTEPGTSATQISEVIITIQTTYGFSDQEVIDMKTNWVGQQGR